MSRRDNDILVTDIVDSCNRILKYTNGYAYEQFKDDDKTVDAVIRNFEIIGEAANNLSDEYKDLYPQVDWHKIRGFRNRIVHDYAGVDLHIVWTIIKNFLPSMLDEINKI